MVVVGRNGGVLNEENNLSFSGVPVYVCYQKISFRLHLMIV